MSLIYLGIFTLIMKFQDLFLIIEMFQGIDAIVDKKDPIVLKLKEWVDEQYKNGRTTAISDEELDSQLNSIVEKKIIIIYKNNMYVNKIYKCNSEQQLLQKNIF